MRPQGKKKRGGRGGGHGINKKKWEKAVYQLPLYKIFVGFFLDAKLYDLGFH
jgi:hypothetical protein